MSILKLSKNDIYKNGEDDKKIKLSRSQISYDSAMVSDWETRNKEAYDTLEQYRQRINSGGYLSADDLSSYRSALDSYVETSTGLRGISKAFGQGEMDDDNTWADTISQMETGYKGLSDYFSQWDTEDAYNAWHQRESFINSYLEDPQKATATMDYQKDWLKEAELRAETRRVLGSEDFGENSKYASTEADDLWEKMWSTYGLGYNDLAYEYINNQNGIRSEIKGKHASFSAGGDLKYEERGYDYMTAEEVGVYNYYYRTEGKERAQAYLDAIEDSLVMRKAGKEFSAMEGKPLREYLYGIVAGTEQFASGIKNIGSLITGDQGFTPSSQYVSGLIRNDLADDGFKILGSSVGQIGYDIVNTTANMLPSILIGAATGGAGGALSMGASATGNAYEQMMNLGYDKNQSRAYSVLVGASEAGLQYLLGGISKLGGKLSGNVVSKLVSKVDNALAKVAITLGGNMLSEGVEEAVQSVLEPVFKSFVTGEDFEGVDLEEVLYSGLLGALSAGFLESGGTVAGNIITNADAKQTYGGSQQELVGEALEINPDNAFAQKMQGRLDKGKNLSGSQLNRLVQQNEATLTAQDLSNIQSAAESRLAELGETGNVSTIAAALTKQAAGEKLSRAEQQAIANSKFAQRVANELNPENIRSGDYSSAWAEQIDTNRINAQEYSRLVEAAQLPQEAEDTTGNQVITEAPNTAQVQQAEPVENPAANIRDNQMAEMQSETSPVATGKESLQVDEESSDAQGDGVTRQVSTGKALEPQKIVSIEGGKAMIHTDSGTVASDDIEFGDADTDLLWRGAVSFNGITPASANGVIRAYRSGVPVTTYLRGAAQEFRNGYYNMDSGGEYADKLTPTQREIIYELGQKAAGENTAKAQAKATKAKKVAVSKMETTTSSQTKVHFDRNGRTFDAVRETALKIMEQLSAALGVEFYVFESYKNAAGELVYKDANGNEVKAPNGYYDLTDGSIHIDLNAGADGKGTMLFTIAHELTHFIKQWSPAKFKVLANFLITQYGKKGVSVEELVETQIAKANKNGRTIDYDAAFEEVVADSMEAMLVSGNVVQMMAELKQRDKTLWQKICEWFKDLVADLKAVADAYKDHKPDSIEGRMIADMQDVIVILESLYTDALTDAAENYQSTKAEKNTSQEGGEAMFSLRGENKDGIEVYETSEEIKRLPYKERQQRFLEIMANEFRGRTAKFIRNGHAYYATFDEKDVNKNIYGDKLSDSKGWKAKINVGADGNIFELVENAQYNGSLPEKGKKIAAHRGVGYWDYFIKNVQIDDTVYDLVANVRKKADGAYVYSIQLNQNKTIEASPPRGSLLRALSGVPNASKQNVAQDADDVKEKFSDRDSNGNELSEEQQEYFKDSKIRDVNGNLKIMHHGSPESFTVFDKKKARSSGYYGKGFYFTDSTFHAQQYGNTYDVYLNITNPIQDGTSEITKDQLRKFVESIAENEDYGIENYGYDATVDSVVGSVYGKSDFAMLMDINASSVGNMVEAIELFNEVNGTNYNGIVATTETVAFYPEQIKRVDNKAPTDDPDIRYSERDGGNDQNADIYSRVFDMREEVGRLQRSIEAFEKSTEFKAANDKLSEAIRNDSITEGVKAYQQWRESSGYAALVDKRDAMRVELENLIQERDVLTANDSAKAEQEAIVKSGISEADYFRKQAVKEFGYTPYFYDAGYMTPNGKMLNFSSEKGRHFGSRGQDHRAIGVIYEDTHGSAAMVRFMNDGNIRIMAETPGLDISSSAEPTKEQYATIRKFAREYGSKERYFAVDISDENGRVVGNYEYDGYVNADRVVNDIKYYFENGTVREQSSVASFLKSERNPELEKVNRVLEKENAELKGDVSYLKELLRLQRTVTGGTKFTKTSVEAAAGQLMKYADAKGDKTELAKLLSSLYEHIAKGEELTWDGVKEAAQPAVEWLQSHTNTREQTNGYAGDILREIRSSRVSLDASQKEEAAYQFGSYNEFRKEAMGSVIVADQDAIPLDSQWQEWSSLYPNIFDPETTSTDMPAALLNAVDRLRSMREADTYGYDKELFGQDLLRQVYDSYWNVSTLYTVADKAQKDINRLKLEHSKRMSDLRQFHKEKTAQLKAEHREALQKVKREQQERLDRKLQQTKEQYQQSREKNAENRRKAEMRKKIRRTIMDLDKLLNKGDKKRNVKEDMKDLVSETLKSADILFTDNYSNEDMVRYGVGTELTEKEAKYIEEAQELMEQLWNLPSGSYEAFQERQEIEGKLKGQLSYRMGKLQEVFSRERARLNKTKVADVLGSLADAYASLESSDQNYVSEAYQDNVYQYLLMLKTDVGGTIVKDMSLNQLEELHKAYTMVLTTVRNANKMFAANLQKTREQLGNQVISEVQRVGGEHGLWLPGEDKLNAFSWNNQKPVYAFERIGSQTLIKLFENIRAGEDLWALDMTEAREYYLEQIRKYKFDSWDFDKQHQFTSASGIDFSLNLEQIMSLYAYSKREQAHDHLLKGGFVFDGNTEVQVNKMGIKVTYLNKTAKAHNVSMEILTDIVSTLTAEQKAFVDAMQDYLSATMGEKGNEVSLQLYGVKLFNEQHYFPLRSAGQFMERAKEADLKKQQGQISIVNSGFAKATTPKSSNPVVLSGFMDVWADHINEMSMYHSFVLPMEDFRRVYNFSSPNMEDGQSVSVNSVIQDAYGEAATGYIDQLYRDLNGGAVSDPRETPAKALIGKFKKAAVFASLSVVVQQPSAIGRAFAIIDPKYFVGSKVDSKRHKALWAELKKYAPVAVIKEMGYFDTGMGKSAQDFIKAKEYGTLKEKAAALFTDGDYRDELLSKAPALADELTWCTIWEAAKRETKAKNPDLKVSSEEFLQLAGKRFTEVITKTQVYDSVLSRSANMRSKGALMSMWTAFLAEPTTTINMMEDALRKGKRGDKKYAAKAMGAVLTSVILNSVLSSMVYAMWDDDEDETFLEKYAQSFATEILEGVNPITYYPFLKDVWSALQGFDIERADMSLITSLTEKITKLVQVYAKDTGEMDEKELAEYNKKLTDAWWGVADYVTAFAGIPVKNVRRDINGAINTVKTIASDLTDRDTSWGSLVDKTWNGVKNSLPIVGWLPDETAADRLYTAIVNGETAYQKRLQSSYATESALNSAIRKGLRANDSRIVEAAIAWNNKDMETYWRIAKKIIAEGNFSKDNVAMAIQAEAKARAKKESNTN